MEALQADKASIESELEQSKVELDKLKSMTAELEGGKADLGLAQRQMEEYRAQVVKLEEEKDDLTEKLDEGVRAGEAGKAGMQEFEQKMKALEAELNGAKAELQAEKDGRREDTMQGSDAQAVSHPLPPSWPASPGAECFAGV